MQKLLGVTLLFFIIFSGTVNLSSAMSLRPLTEKEKEEIQKLPDVCGIDGKTYKEGKNYINASTYPRLAITIAYTGACKTQYNLSSQIEKRIEEKLLLFFEENEIIEYVGRGMQPKYPKFTMKGTQFIASNYYPYIQKTIKAEMTLQNLDNQKIAILNYTAWFVGDAYYSPRIQHANASK